MVITPDISTLKYTVRNGIKFFELVSEPVNQEIPPGVFIKGWWYNGSIPGPTIQVYPGDYVSIRVINRLPKATNHHPMEIFAPDESLIREEMTTWLTSFLKVSTSQEVRNPFKDISSSSW